MCQFGRQFTSPFGETREPWGRAPLACGPMSDSRRSSALDIAQVEAWARSGLTDRPEGSQIVVHARGGHIHVEEQRPRDKGGMTSRSIIRFRYLSLTDTWTVHRAAAAGRWIDVEPLEGSLGEVLDQIDLRNLPAS